MPSRRRPRTSRSGGLVAAAAIGGGLLLAVVLGVGALYVLGQNPRTDESGQDGDPRSGDPAKGGLLGRLGGLVPKSPPGGASAKSGPGDPPPGYRLVSAPEGGFAVFLPAEPKPMSFTTNGKPDTNWVGYGTMTEAVSAEVKSVRLGPTYTPGVTPDQILLDLKRFTHVGIRDEDVVSTAAVTMSGRAAIEVRVRDHRSATSPVHVYCATSDETRFFSVHVGHHDRDADPATLKVVRDSFHVLPTVSGGLPATATRPPPNYSVVVAPEGGFQVFVPGLFQRRGFATGGAPDANWVGFAGGDKATGFDVVSVLLQPPATPGQTPEQLFADFKRHGNVVRFDVGNVESTAVVTLGGRPAVEVRNRERPRLVGQPGDPVWARQNQEEIDRVAREGEFSVCYVTSDDRRLYLLCVRRKKDPPTPEMLQIVRDSFTRI